MCGWRRVGSRMWDCLGVGYEGRWEREGCNEVGEEWGGSSGKGERRYVVCK